MPREVSRTGLQEDSSVYPDCHLHMYVVTYMRANVSLNVLSELKAIKCEACICNW